MWISLSDTRTHTLKYIDTQLTVQSSLKKEETYVQVPIKQYVCIFCDHFSKSDKK